MENTITDFERDTLKELVNIGVGKAAAILNDMLGMHIDLEVPNIDVLRLSEIEMAMEGLKREKAAAITIGFEGSFMGRVAMVLPATAAANLVSALTGEEMGTPDLDTVKIGTLKEIGNIVINGVMGTISNVLELSLTYSLPRYDDDYKSTLAKGSESDDPYLLLLYTYFTIQQLAVHGHILIVFDNASFELLRTTMKALQQG